MNADALEYLRRNSGLSVDSEGVFHSMGQKVPNDRVQKLFHDGLAVLPSGDVTLRVGKVWAYVNTSTVAQFAIALKRIDSHLDVSMINGERFQMVRPCVGMGPDNRFYLWEGEDTFPAVLLRRAHTQLAEILEERDGLVGFYLGQEWILVRQLDASPGPADPP